MKRTVEFAELAPKKSKKNDKKRKDRRRNSWDEEEDFMENFRIKWTELKGSALSSPNEEN